MALAKLGGCYCSASFGRLRSVFEKTKWFSGPKRHDLTLSNGFLYNEYLVQHSHPWRSSLTHTQLQLRFRSDFHLILANRLRTLLDPSVTETPPTVRFRFTPNSTQGMAWAMPTQPWCNETSWVYLGSTSDSDGGETDCGDDQAEFSCLWLEFTIIPFQVGSLCCACA